MSCEYPEVIELDQTETQAKLKLFVPETLKFFEGHFPGFPLLPGVAQIFWVMHYCEELLGITSNFRGFNQLKFSMPILPGTTVQLELTFDATRSWVMFKFFNTQGSMSSGKILLG